MNRKLLLTLGIVALIALAGCVEDGPDGSKIDANMSENVEGVEPGASYWYEIRLTEKNQKHLVQKRPPFTMEDSLERQNLIRRYEYLNDQNNVHHVYLMSHDGKVVSYFVAQGKVSSVNSKLTNDQQIVVDNRCLETTHADAEGACFKTVESPQMDGSYGTNGAAIFFFTTDGQYVEWNGLYVVSEEPKSIQTSVTLVEETNSTSGGS
jgi:hypothetical protein